MLSLISLPVDLLIVILEPLGLEELIAVSFTCHALYSVVTEYGWTNYLRNNHRPSYSLSRARSLWSPRTRAQYDVMADQAWESSKFIARPLSRMWAGKLQPVLAINPSRLVVGAGSNLYSYTFGVSKHPPSSPPIVHEGTVSLLHTPERTRNITALSFVDDGGLDATLDVAFQDGAIERIQLITAEGLSFARSKVPSMPNRDFVESISSESNVVLALSSNGYARLSSNEANVSTIDLKSRSWVSSLCLQASAPYAVFGIASTTPLVVHALHEGGQLSSQPTAILHTKKGAELPVDKLPSSAVYGLSRGPMNSPWGSSPEILVSGWFDGQVRCYDLRAASHGRDRALRPVLSLADRWSYEPIYSVSCGGGSAAHIAAGTARHSVVSFWDVRAPASGWSVHAPGNDPSPVYSVVLESSRFFGVTQSRPFVYDFGPGASLDTYPPIPQVRGVDNLKHKKGSDRATYHVLRYEHSSSGLCNEH